MTPRTRATVSVVAILGLVVALGAVLNANRDRAAEAGGGAPPAVPPPTASAPAGGAPSPRRPPPAPHRERELALDPALAAFVEQRVAEAVAVAADRSGGRANGSTCVVAIRAIDAATGRVVLERLPDAALEPASNAKLLTSLSALLALGPDRLFVTPVEAVGELDGGALRGDLVVRAGGDPLYTHEDPDAAVRRLDALARELSGAGVERVTGDLVLDLATFPAPDPAPGWPRPEGWFTQSYALVSGLTVHAGVVRARVEPTSSGGRARVGLSPGPLGRDWRNDCRTKNGSLNDVRVDWARNRDWLGVSGSIGTKLDRVDAWFAHPDPVELFGAVFSESLARAGVALEGGVRVERDAPPGVELARLETPLRTLIGPVNTDSTNSPADALFLALGLDLEGEATREASARAVRRVLADLDLPVDGHHQVDGSGLSRDDRATVRLLTELLDAVLRMDADVRREFLVTLALAGETGTLAGRFQDSPARGRVRAKTGFIVGASALSGVATTLGGREVAFSILVAYPRVDGLNNAAWKPMHDDLVTRLVEWTPAWESGS